MDAVAKVLAENPPLEPVCFDRLKLDRQTGVLRRDGKMVRQLTGQQTKLLAGFMMARNNFLSHTATYDILYWDRGEAGEPRPESMTSWVSHLRKFLKPAGYIIKSYSGRGYRLEQDSISNT